ncbi:hypothetical protein ACFE04_027254 [Oxalis oulophora]
MHAPTTTPGTDYSSWLEKMAITLEKVAKTYLTVVVSDRANDKATDLTFKVASMNVYDEMRKVKSFVNLKRISYAGSHGVDLLIPACLRADKEETCLIFKAASRNVYYEMRKVLISLEEVTNVPKAKLEDNSYSVTVHYKKWRRLTRRLLSRAER